MAASARSRPPATGILGGFAYLLVGWCGLLVPALIRSIEATHHRSDAEFGVYYLVFGLTYAAGSFGGGLVTERAGRRPVLVVAAGLLAAGLVALAVVSSWGGFLLAAVPAGLGVGALDGGANGLFHDVFRSSRGRALNLLHLCFSLGALSAPLVIGLLVEVGFPWQGVLAATGLVVVGLGALVLMVEMPDVRRGSETPFARPGQEGLNRGAGASPGRWASSAWRSPATSPPRWASPTGWSASSSPPR